jgi:hypothetical protein
VGHRSLPKHLAVSSVLGSRPWPLLNKRRPFASG